MNNQKETAELAARVKAGNQRAFSELAVQYRPLIEHECLRRAGRLAVDELSQAALIGLYSAACSFDPSLGVTFGAYARVCVSNRIDSELRAVRPSNEPLDEENAGTDISPEEAFLSDESYRLRLASIDRILSDYEKQVFMLYLQGESYKFIAARLGKSEKSVDGALTRSRAKLRAALARE